MNIAIMMRAMEQDSGHRAIVEGLVEHMLRLGATDVFHLFYRTGKWLGRFAAYPNAREAVLSARHKLFWDQVLIPWHAWRAGADIIFNPKFSVPLISPCPVVMGLHEPAWWAWPRHYERVDRTYMKLMLPIYVRRAAHLFPISQFVVDENLKYLRFPREKATVAYPAPKEYFRPAVGCAELAAFRAALGLPRHFLLSVTRVDHPGVDRSKSFFPGKNVETVIRAYRTCRDRIPHRLVVVGRRVEEYLHAAGFTEDDLEGIIFTGFVKHEAMPSMLGLADLVVFPSFYESYAMALVEAMACGCPVVASETGACPEITAGAALLANPHRAEDFADKILRVVGDPGLRRTMRERGLQRSASFRWDRSARAVLQKMREIVERHTAPPNPAPAPRALASARSPSAPPDRGRPGVDAAPARS